MKMVVFQEITEDELIEIWVKVVDGRNVKLSWRQAERLADRISKWQKYVMVPVWHNSMVVVRVCDRKVVMSIGIVG